MERTSSPDDPPRRVDRPLAPFRHQRVRGRIAKYRHLLGEVLVFEIAVGICAHLSFPTLGFFTPFSLGDADDRDELRQIDIDSRKMPD
jgi:hypothetical protein